MLLIKAHSQHRGAQTREAKTVDVVVNSVLLYGSEVWADTTKIAKCRQKISSAQRQVALRIASAYHTESLAAMQVVASVIPIDQLALERKYIFGSVEEREVVSTRARSDSMDA